VGFWAWLKQYALNWGVGDTGGQSADRHALIDIDLDHKKRPAQADNETGRSGEPDDSAQAP
jgi:hypothetical protein